MKAIFEIVNEDYKLVAIPNSAGIGNTDNFTLTKVISTKVNTKNDKGVLLDQLNWTVKPGGCTMPGFTLKSGSGSLTPTAIKCMAEKKKIYLKLDKGNCTGSFAPNGPYASVPCACTIMIIDAGQTKVKGA